MVEIGEEADRPSILNAMATRNGRKVTARHARFRWAYTHAAEHAYGLGIHTKTSLEMPVSREGR